MKTPKYVVNWLSAHDSHNFGIRAERTTALENLKKVRAAGGKKSNVDYSGIP